MSGETQVPTQGRWVIDTMHSYSYIAPDPMDQTAGNNGGYVICQLFGPDAPANANLFMASRKMLAALQSIVASLAEHDDEGMIEHAEQMIAARTAIAEATGEQP